MMILGLGPTVGLEVTEKEFGVEVQRVGSKNAQQKAGSQTALFVCCKGPRAGWMNEPCRWPDGK